MAEFAKVIGHRIKLLQGISESFHQSIGIYDRVVTSDQIYLPETFKGQ